MARRYRSGTIETTVSIDLGDVLDEIGDDQLLAEVRSRNLAADVEAQATIDAEFLENVARTIELGRLVDRTETRLIAARIRDMISVDNRRALRAAEAYQRWNKNRSAEV